MAKLRILFLAGLLAALVVLSSHIAVHSQAGTPSAADSDDIVSRAKSMVDALAAGDDVSAGQDFDAAMQSALPPDKLKAAWAQLIAQAGAYKQQIGTRTAKFQQYDIVFVAVAFEQANIDVRVVFSTDKKIAGLFFQPAASAPQAATGTATDAYQPVDTDTFHEENVTIGSDPWKLPGTLTLPKSSGPYPVVVLVQGSGPSDRDEAIGPNKPFRDLAWGLAAQGIAVLRYDKRTFVYEAQMLQVQNLTVKDEAIDDTLAAVALLRTRSDIDTKRIFVLGHSLGGELIPRIGAADSSLAGLIVMAGGTRKLEDAILEQTQYIISLGGTLTPDQQAQVDAMAAQVAQIKKLTPADAASSTMILGAPASYWLDLESYNPPDVARTLKQPMLILQGERDYQVTMAEFQNWKDALSGRQNVTFKSYPALNHLFIAGTGQITPQEYTVAGHVDPTVIDDIAQWLKSLKPQ